MRLPSARRFVVGCMEFDWVVRWFGSCVQSFYSATGWVGLGQSFSGLCLVEEIGPPQTALIHSKRTETRDAMYSRFRMPVRLYVCPPAYLNSFLSVLSVVVARSSPAGVLSYLSI